MNQNDIDGEKVVDLLREVKQQTKHPNKAYKELLVLFGVTHAPMKKRNRISKKMIETEKYVDNYIERHKYPPTYRAIADHFSLASTSASYARCRGFREKMICG